MKYDSEYQDNEKMFMQENVIRNYNLFFRL